LIFCFDALDEVKSDDFSEVVDNLKHFIQKYNQSTFLISCRKNYLNKWQYLFSEIDFDYVALANLIKKGDYQKRMIVRYGNTIKAIEIENIAYFYSPLFLGYH